MIGQRLGPYEVVAKLGEGGMGQVYRAKDTRLDRMVAIKVLHDDRTNDPDRRQRFEREARAVAAFSHPNVCAIFDVGHEGDVTYLVMEYLDGETLASRLERGSGRTSTASRTTPKTSGVAPSSGDGGLPAVERDINHALPVPETIRISTALAEALAAAHKAGIVHRDLKPGNIMLTRTGVKVLDFGLARMTGRDPGAAGATVTGLAPLTGAGMLLGTLPYMSPEQVEGKEVDARSDIFALGSVIYEMATGRRAFDAAGQASLIAAILERQPAPISEIQPVAPAGLERIVHTCLEKNPDDRWQHASDIARQLRWLSAETESARPGVGTGGAADLSSVSTLSNVPGQPGTADAGTAQPRRPFGWPLAAITIATLGFGGYFGTLALSRRGTPAAVGAVHSGAVHFQVNVPGVTLTQAAVSPDGRTLALVGRRADSAMGLWLKRLDQSLAEPLDIPGFTGTGGAVWSPDGRELAVSTARGLVAMRLDGGVVRPLTSEPFVPTSWGTAGTILGRRQDNLRMLNAGTGELTASGIFSISSTFLPDGRQFLNIGRRSDSGNPDGLYLSSIDLPSAQRPITSFRSIVKIADGHLLFVRDGVIFAQPFDADRAQLSGEAKAIADGSTYFLPNGRSDFDAAAGTIAYFTREPDDVPVWIDRRGAETGRLGSPGLYNEVKISPDGRRAVIYQIDRRQGTGDLWLRDLTRDSVTRLTNDEYSESRIVWSPDSRSIVYGWDGNGPPDVYRLDVDRGGPAQPVYRTPTVDYPWAWLPGNRLLVTTSGDGPRVVGLDGTIDASVTDVPRQANGASPDGRWATLVGASTGLSEVSIQPLGRPGSPMIVSSGGGQDPVWARDGRSLYYRRENSIFVVRNQSTSGGDFAASPPELVMSLPRAIRDFDVTPDGQRFLVLRSAPADFLPLQVIINWQAKMR